MSATHEGPIRHDAPWPRRSTTGWLGLWLVLALVAALTMPAAARGTPLRAGTLSAWGQNNHGLLGDGTTTNSTSPVAVTGLTDVVAVAGGDYHSLAVRRDGSVWAWGRNRAGQLGEGTATNSMLPVAVTGLSDAVEVAAGGDHSLAVRRGGTVAAWGSNDHGQLGDGTTTNSALPVAVTGLSDVVAVAAGYSHSPVTVPGLSDVVAVAPAATTVWRCAVTAASPPGGSTTAGGWVMAPTPAAPAR
jgi:hypothetical protein